MPQPLLEIQDLRAQIKAREGTVRVLNGVSLSVAAGHVTGIMGESGCGKTSLALAILSLLPRTGKVTGGQVLFEGENLTQAKERRLNQVRGKEIAMVFQDANASLNPLFTIGSQIEEVVTVHTKTKKEEVRVIAAEALRRVGVPDPESVMERYAFQLSGGMRQRALLAMAMVLHPKLLIADEPTSEQDLIVQGEILVQLKRIRDEEQTAILLISHDLGVIAEMTEDVTVLYAGYVVEQGPTRDVFRRPRHPYTYALIGSAPSMTERQTVLPALPGKPPDMIDLPKGCPFLPRCGKALAVCRTQGMPPLTEVEPGHKIACYNPVRHDW